MLIVKDCIVSDHLADLCFACDLAKCKGACCVEGDSGAPLLESEVAVLEAILPEVEPYMTPEGIAAVREQGVAVRDKEGDLGTPLIDGSACAYISYGDDGCALCAIEKAYRLSPFTSHLSPFPKPVSCHLYPIRVEDYGEFTAVNYHRWEVCRAAIGHGDPLYIYLKEPLIRRFGSEWYEELLEQINIKKNEQYN